MSTYGKRFAEIEPQRFGFTVRTKRPVIGSDGRTMTTPIEDYDDKWRPTRAWAEACGRRLAQKRDLADARRKHLKASTYRIEAD